MERDLHDGAQVRLAAVTMNLGMAQDKTGDSAVRELLDAAQTGVGEALADLRRIARGIHPPVLDNGLADALDSLAASSPIPATVRADVRAAPVARDRDDRLLLRGRAARQRDQAQLGQCDRNKHRY